MDPLQDEKVVLTLARGFSEYIKTNLLLGADKEAYGPSKNEGLCYESCYGIGFNGQVNGTMYFCMDGYTKLKMLPRIARRFQVDLNVKGMADSILLEFSNQIASTIVNELQEGGFEMQLEPPDILNNKLVPIDLELYRQYILIFFLSDRRERSYMGRIYLILLLKKYLED